jgi:hypothetical protein
MPMMHQLTRLVSAKATAKAIVSAKDRSFAYVEKQEMMALFLDAMALILPRPITVLIQNLYLQNILS